MLKSVVKRMACAAAGGITGAAFGAFLVPFYWAGDVISPVAYPLAGASGVACAFLGHKEKVPKPGLLLGAAAGACAVPFTPLIAAVRPVVVPFVWGTLGTMVAVAVTGE